MIDRNRRRQFGQNYLKDPAILFEMGEAINASRNENIFHNMLTINTFDENSHN